MIAECFSSHLNHGLVRFLVGELRVIKVNAADPKFMDGMQSKAMAHT